MVLIQIESKAAAAAVYLMTSLGWTVVSGELHDAHACKQALTELDDLMTDEEREETVGVAHSMLRQMTGEGDADVTQVMDAVKADRYLDDLGHSTEEYEH